jgi:hypothetical protein
MKKFIVTGTPRSGTTFLCKQIAALDNVVMYDDWDYEPFGGYGGVLDEEEYLRQLQSDHPDKIVGLKTFWQDSFFMNEHLKRFDPIVLIRKDIQKVYLSLIVLYRRGYDQDKSSRWRPGAETIEYSDFGLTSAAHTLLKTYYYSEKMPNLFKLYFEELTKENTILDDYFENKVNLDPGYTGSTLTDYHPDPERFLSILKRTALGMNHKKLPYYVRENLHI